MRIRALGRLFKKTGGAMLWCKGENESAPGERIKIKFVDSAGLGDTLLSRTTLVDRVFGRG